MRRITVMLSLVAGLITSLVVAAGVAARSYDPPDAGVVAIEVTACPSTATPSAVVPGGVYRAMVDELRDQGYTRTQIEAEVGHARVSPSSGSPTADADSCT